MLENKKFDEFVSLIVQIYQDMEMDLLMDIAKRFNTYKTIGGSLEWYLKMIEQMNALDNESIHVIARYSKKSETYIRSMLKKAQMGNIDIDEIQAAYNQGFSKVTYQQLIKNAMIKEIFEDSYKEVNASLRLIQTSAKESCHQIYMDVLNKTFIEVASGTYSYDVAIRKGIQDMARKGVTGATYKRKDGSIIRYSIEAAVRRDTLSAVHKIANETALKSIKLMGAEYVDVSSHIGARINDKIAIANHAGWQGKQYKIEGSEKDYPNFADNTGYGNIQGFGGVNCRHRVFAFFPGISTPFAVQYDEEANRQYYENTQRLRKLEREMRSLKKQVVCLDEVGADDMVSILDAKIKKKSEEIDAFCKQKGLRRDHTREVIGHAKKI